MTQAAISIYIFITFFISLLLLHRYANWKKYPIVLTLGVFVAWFFALLAIAVLPVDISNAAYRTCVINLNVSSIKNVKTNQIVNLDEINAAALTKDNETTTLSALVSDDIPSLQRIIASTQSSTTIVADPLSSASSSPEPFTTLSPPSSSPAPSPAPLPDTNDIIMRNCSRPWSLVRKSLLKILWRLIYWTAFFLNWFILPVMQSYSEAGDFSTKKKIQSALKHRFTYYRNMAILFVFAFIYYAVKFGIEPNNIISICISISNTSGLIIMLPLLGYGLVDLPRKMYHKSLYKRRLDFLYYKVAKVNEDKCVAEQQLDEVLEKVKHAYQATYHVAKLNNCMRTILVKCPNEFQDQLLLREPSPAGPSVRYSEEDLVQLHKQVIKCMFDNNRAQRQWQNYISKAIDWEDVRLNRENPNRVFQSSFASSYVSQRYSTVLFKKFIYTPTVQWWWKCYVQPRTMRCLTFVFATFSAIIIWSEFTFVIQKEPLSIFEFMYNAAVSNHKYFLIEFFSLLTLVYMFSCTFVALFKIRLYDYFYLAPKQQTSESSLAMSGINFCRMVIPLCLNYLGIIHLDSHVLKQKVTEETLFTSIMGHLDLFSDAFFLFTPIILLLVCFLTYFNLIPKLLNLFGQEQFLVDSEMTNILVSDGEAFVNREKSKRARQLESKSKQDRWREAAQQRLTLRAGVGDTRSATNTSGSDSHYSSTGPAASARSSALTFANELPQQDKRPEVIVDHDDKTDNDDTWDFLDFVDKPSRSKLDHV